MKIRNKFILLPVILLILLSFTACAGNWEAPYTSLEAQGGTVRVRFDANGGLFAGTKDVSIVDVYDISQVYGGVYLLSPDDPIRGSGCFSVTRNGYFLAGWYTQRELRVNESGQPLDEFGVLCSKSGREQGYTYSGLWNFGSDKLQLDSSIGYDSETPTLTMTLYAAWIPYINYDFYSVSASGDVQFIERVQAVQLELPQWSDKTGKLNLNGFPSVDGATFDRAFLDEALTQPLDASLSGSDSYVDFESGTLNVESVKIYTTWMEGVWFKIRTPEQFLSNARPDGNYILEADLDFSNAVWPPALIKSKFSGRILGNGHTISNLNVVQADNSQIYGGLFGSLEDGAAITDLTFENVSFTIQAGSRMQGATFGLLSGSRATGATLENVQVTGQLLISKNCYPSDYTIGLLCGSGSTDGVNYTIECRVAEENADNLTVTVHDDDTVTVTFH
jgi:hypothetical protein